MLEGDEAGPGDRGCAGQDRKARSPARCGGPQWAALMCVSKSAGLLRVMVSRCVPSSLCTFVQQSCVEKLSYILSFHGPGHGNIVTALEVIIKVFSEKKPGGIIVRCWP